MRGRVPLHAEAAGVCAGSGIRPQEIERVRRRRPAGDWERSKVTVESTTGDAFAHAIQQHVIEGVIRRDVEIGGYARKLVAAEIARRPPGELPRRDAVRPGGRQARPLRDAIGAEPCGMPVLHDCRDTAGHVRVMRIARARRGERAIGGDARVEQRRDFFPKRNGCRRGRRAFLVKLYFTQSSELAAIALIGRDVETHVTNARRVHLEMLARLRREAARLDE